MTIRLLLPLIAALGLVAAPAAAQTAAPPPIIPLAVPPLPTPNVEKTAAGDTATIGRNLAGVIAADLATTGRFALIGPDTARVYGFAEATGPQFRLWRATAAKALVSGFVEARPDGRLTVACYVFDVASGRELARQGFVVAPADWRRAAHRCSDAAYAKLTGNRGLFDTAIAYVAESGPPTARVKRIAVMDADGSNHRYVTAGETAVLTPRWSPRGDRLAYTAFTPGGTSLQIVDLAAEQPQVRALVPGTGINFAPRFSPDGRQIAFSMASNGNTDIYVVGADGGGLQRLTTMPGVDTSPSFSPDGSKIVFESDRSGGQQLYVMNADGSDQRRISFGASRYASPAWSPRGDLIAFTRITGPNLAIGVISPAGIDERVISNAWQDEGPSWASNGETILFHRTDPASGRTSLRAVSLNGGIDRRVGTPQDGSDADWSAVQDEVKR
ncbi:Tol-Pal system beta propeller repeat protein TolB [Sphingomonas sp.]|uniref:Tol-Pal system beta propeller repeat protein TolB n=1 Tax=Sphingomonas sp. TaxID=28214 RepID=UPI00286E8F9B|nr:Tol-Pal system beta propeller repeat protein TolB [Sphingomonas sp.]